MFTKKDLRSGDLVVHPDGSMRQVFLNTDERDIVAGNLHTYLDNYSSDFKCDHGRGGWDIVKIYRPSKDKLFTPSTVSAELLWQREEELVTIKISKSDLDKMAKAGIKIVKE